MTAFAYRINLRILIKKRLSMTLTTASFISNVEAFLRPQILYHLLFRPVSSAAGQTHVRQHRLLPSLETYAMHILTNRAIRIAAYNLKQRLKSQKIDHLYFQSKAYRNCIIRIVRINGLAYNAINKHCKDRKFQSET